MRVVHLSYDYGLSGTSGAPIAATRLHLALLRAGIDSHFVCVRQIGEGPNVHRLPVGGLTRKLFYFFPRCVWGGGRFVSIGRRVNGKCRRFRQISIDCADAMVSWEPKT